MSMLWTLALLGVGYLAGLGIGTVWAEQRSMEGRQVPVQISAPVSAEPVSPSLVFQVAEAPETGLPSTITLQDNLGLAASLPTAQPQPMLFVQAATPVPLAKPAPAPTPASHSLPEEYRIGIDDILDIHVLQPEELATTVTVGPDGLIAFPFIGSVSVKGLAISQIQEEVQRRLADGYMKYPVVSVSLKESRSRKFFVYGEVIKPGPYAIEEHTTILRGISMAGGFTKFGSSSHVKLLRPNPDGPGYQTLKINMKAVMDGDSNKDLPIQPGDIIVVSEGMF